MAKRIAKFHKVSYEQFKEGYIDTFGNVEDAEILKVYEDIKLPKRATRGSAGYDCFAPFDITLEPGDDIKVPTGIKCFMEDDDVLQDLVLSLHHAYMITFDSSAAVKIIENHNGKRLVSSMR